MDDARTSPTTRMRQRGGGNQQPGGAPEPTPRRTRSSSPTLRSRLAAANDRDGLPPPSPRRRDAWCVDLGCEMRAMSTFEVWTALASGTFGPEVRVWKEGMECWSPVETIPELVCALDATAELLPPPAARAQPAPPLPPLTLPSLMPPVSMRPEAGLPDATLPASTRPEPPGLEPDVAEAVTGPMARPYPALDRGEAPASGSRARPPLRLRAGSALAGRRGMTWIAGGSAVAAVSMALAMLLSPAPPFSAPASGAQEPSAPRETEEPAADAPQTGRSDARRCHDESGQRRLRRGGPHPSPSR
jgi:hypothetical protein